MIINIIIFSLAIAKFLCQFSLKLRDPLLLISHLSLNFGHNPFFDNPKVLNYSTIISGTIKEEHIELFSIRFNLENWILRLYRDRISQSNALVITVPVELYIAFV